MNRIKLQIISSQLQAEEKLPAVRELATEVRINQMLWLDFEI